MAGRPCRYWLFYLLDFEEFLEKPDIYLHLLARFLGVEHRAPAIVEHYQQIAGGYSKNMEREFSQDDRREKMLAAKEKRGAMFAKNIEWTRALIRKHPELAGLEKYL